MYTQLATPLSCYLKIAIVVVLRCRIVTRCRLFLLIPKLDCFFIFGVYRLCILARRARYTVTSLGRLVCDFFPRADLNAHVIELDFLQVTKLKLCYNFYRLARIEWSAVDAVVGRQL